MPDHALPSVSEADVVKGRQAMTYAIDSSRIEGLTVSPEVIAIMERQNRGEITTDEALALVHEFHGTL
ncbi:MAG: antitoxin VbhA family protein [Janthinobacterium lividum]